MRSANDSPTDSRESRVPGQHCEKHHVDAKDLQTKGTVGLVRNRSKPGREGDWFSRTVHVHLARREGGWGGMECGGRARAGDL